MFFLRISMMALRSLLIHPLRSILATLGVIIGVGAVVAAMAILQGMKASFESAFESVGSSRLVIGPSVERRAGRIVGNFDALKLEDAGFIQRECGTVVLTMPQITNSGLIKFLSKSTTSNVLGATDLYTKINNHHVEEGEFISKAAVQGRARVAGLGSRVRRELFGGRPAIDEKIKISGTLGSRTFTVIGVMEEKGVVGFTDVDRQVIIPVTTAMDKLYGVKSIQMILADAVSPADEDIESAKTEIKKCLRRRHKIRAGQQDDFQVSAQKELVETVGTLQTMVGVVLGAIAGISLVVGGIGIMNIMLVAVTERTREIGVRMAMGAQRADLMKQFLVEASIVSFLGGSLGVLMGWALGKTLEFVTDVIAPVTTAGSIAMALAMATFVGIVSGIYPAWKASRLDPVEALRYE